MLGKLLRDNIQLNRYVVFVMRDFTLRLLKNKKNDFA